MVEGEGITGTGWESMLVTSRIWANVDQRNKIVAALLRSAWERSSSRFHHWPSIHRPIGHGTVRGELSRAATEPYRPARAGPAARAFAPNRAGAD
jgi:hypothetical protein